MNSQKLRVSVVIVVWNAKKYVIECLQSLKDHCSGICTEVIIVDNASSDGTPELVAQSFPEFKLIRNSDNLGFSKANDIGIAQASGDYVCLVNSDVEFTNDCISPMIAYLQDHPSVGMIGPKMLSMKDRETVLRSTMRFPTLWNSFCRALGLDRAFRGSRLFGGLLMSDFDHHTTGPVEVLNGWFLVVRRRAIERVGVLDPRFFMYGEDVDWSYRFWQAGEQVVFFAESGAIHYGGASSANAPVRFYLEQCFANWQYWRKHHGFVSQVTYLGILALHQCVRIFGAIVGFCFKPRQRAESARIVQRSWACLQWLMQPQRRPLEIRN